MDPKIKQRWVKALRSEKYQQSLKGYLFDSEDGSYCCLGVLCKVIGAKDQLEAPWAFPENHVLAEVGMPKSSSDHPFWELAAMNDKGKTFSEIADVIERKF